MSARATATMTRAPVELATLVAVPRRKSMTDGALERQTLSVVLCLVLVLATMGSGADAAMLFQSQGAAPSGGIPRPSHPGQGAPETAEELQALVAPIALYPDALVAQILGAATFPDQIAVANYWLQQNKDLTGTALGQAVNKQTWDPSVKALTQFPSVLNNMAQNLSWTSQLGEAYHNQQADVMTAIQTLRAKAKADGNLKSGSQITVVQQSPRPSLFSQRILRLCMFRCTTLR